MFILRIFTAPGIHINHETASAWRSSFQSFCAEVEETHKKSHSNWHRCRIASTNTYRRRASFYNSVAYYLQVFGRRQLLIRTFTYTTVYTECPRSNVPDFGRVFLMLKYTDITQNTYIQSSTVTEIMTREKWGLLAVPNTATCTADTSRDSANVLESGMQCSLCLRDGLRS